MERSQPNGSYMKQSVGECANKRDVAWFEAKRKRKMVEIWKSVNVKW